MEDSGFIINTKVLIVKTRIKELRAKYNWTQEDLAKKVNVRRETIIFLEKGKYNPSLQLAYTISKQFNLSIEEVFIFNDDKP
jgi:putative transcriptional regulator